MLHVLCIISHISCMQLIYIEGIFSSRALLVRAPTGSTFTYRVSGPVQMNCELSTMYTAMKIKYT